MQKDKYTIFGTFKKKSFFFIFSLFLGKKVYLCNMKTVVKILGFSSGTRVAAGMFDGLKEGSRLFGRLLGVGVDGR